MQVLNYFQQRTGSNGVWKKWSSGTSQAASWNSTLTLHLAHREPGTMKIVTEGATWTSTGQGRSQKNASEAAATKLFCEHRADVQRRLQCWDTRTGQSFSYVTAVEVLSRRTGPAHELFIGPEHAHMLVKMGRVSGVVAIDTEGYTNRFHEWHLARYFDLKAGCWPATHWLQAYDGVTVVILPFLQCEAAISDFLQRTDITKVFCDSASDLRALPDVAAPVADIQLDFLDTYGGEYDGRVSLKCMVERLVTGHKHRLISTEGDDFYRGFQTDNIADLSNIHIDYMVADALATYWIYARIQK